MKIVLSLILTVMSISLLAGCNTVNGFGQDLQAGGKNLQKAAVDNK